MTTPQSDPIQTWMEGLGFKWFERSWQWVRLDDPNDITSQEISISQKTAAFFYAVMKREKLEARIDELQIEATRFNKAGYKGLPPGFQKRMNELQRQLATLNKGEETE